MGTGSGADTKELGGSRVGLFHCCFIQNFLLVLVNTGCCESLEYRLHAALHHLPTASPLPPPPGPAPSCRYTVQGVCEVTGRSRRALCYLGMDQRNDQVRGTVVMETTSQTTTHTVITARREWVVCEGEGVWYVRGGCAWCVCVSLLATGFKLVPCAHRDPTQARDHLVTQPEGLRGTNEIRRVVK